MAQISSTIVFCIMFMFHVLYASCYTHDDMTTLINDLLNESRYSKVIRPLYSQDKLMQVNITPSIMTIERLDVYSEELLVIAYLIISWVDEYLVWNPKDYGGISKLLLPYDRLWVPPLSQFGGALKENTGKIINPGFAPMVIGHTGVMFLITTGYFVTKCDIDTRLYPFDNHMCTFTFVSGLHDISEIELNSHFGGFTFDYFQNNHAWSVKSEKYRTINYSSQDIGYSISGVEFKLVLQRRPRFELINSYIPIFLLALLNIATSLVPPNSGERLSFAITLYLSFIFISTALIDEMPHVAVKIAVSSYIMLSLNILNTASVLWSVFIVRLSNWQTSPRQIPKLLINVMSCYCKGITSDGRKVHPLNKTDLHFEQEEHTSPKDTGSLDGKENNNPDGHVLKIQEMSWLHVAVVLDKIYFTMTIVFYAIVVLVMVLYWLLQK